MTVKTFNSMKTTGILMCLLAFLSLLAGCSSKPRLTDGEKALKERITKESEGRLRLVAFIGHVPFALLVFQVRRWLDAPRIVPLFVGAWFLFIAVTVVGAGYFRCPRCNKRFFATWLVRNPFASRCLHCSLPKWASHDPEGSAEVARNAQTSR